MSRPLRLAPPLALALALGACDTILDIPERALDPHVSCDDGPCVCTGGFDSCDGSDENGCETNLRFDPTNCGQCGHNCVDTLCKESLCSSGVVVGNETDTISDMALEGGFIYYTNRFGSPIREFAIQEVRSRDIPGSQDAFWLRLKDRIAYATNTNAVWAIPLDEDGPAVALASDAGAIGNMAVGGGRLYWVAGPLPGEPPGVYKLFGVPTDGSSEPVKIYESAPYAAATDVAADEQRVYWADKESIVSAAHGASVPQPTLITRVEAPPTRLLVDKTSIYWIDKTGVSKAPLTGGPPEVLAKGPEDSVTLQLAIDAKDAFFALQPGGQSSYYFRKVPLSGGDGVDIGLTPQLDREKQILTDDKFVYWIANNTVRRIAK